MTPGKEALLPFQIICALAPCCLSTRQARAQADFCALPVSGPFSVRGPEIQIWPWKGRPLLTSQQAREGSAWDRALKATSVTVARDSYGTLDPVARTSPSL